VQLANGDAILMKLGRSLPASVLTRPAFTAVFRVPDMAVMGVGGSLFEAAIA